MKFFTNKHIVTAFIVTPILAMGGWFAVDLVVKEKPHVAEAGQSYPLSAKSNCRFSSGKCDLVNAEFKSQLVVVQERDTQFLTLSSSHALDSVNVGFRDLTSTTEEDEVIPKPMQRIAGDMTSWSIEMPFGLHAMEEAELLIAMQAKGSLYYAETTMAFSEYKTSFNKDFRAE